MSGTYYWTAEFTDGLIVYLSFDEGKGKTTKDVSGNKNDGTLEGPLKWEDGKFGKALRFETGAGTWVKVESNKQMNVDKFKQVLGKELSGDEIKSFQIQSLALGALINNAVFENEFKINRIY